jgi:hypothetical protein
MVGSIAYVKQSSANHGSRAAADPVAHGLLFREHNLLPVNHLVGAGICLSATLVVHSNGQCRRFAVMLSCVVEIAKY